MSKNSLVTFVTAVQSYSAFIRPHLMILKTDILVSDLLPAITKEGLLYLSYLFVGKVEKDLVPLGLLSFKMIPHLDISRYNI